MKTLKVRLIVDVPKPAWCHGQKGKVFEVYDDGLDYMLADGSGCFLGKDQVEVIEEPRVND